MEKLRPIGDEHAAWVAANCSGLSGGRQPGWFEAAVGSNVSVVVPDPRLPLGGFLVKGGKIRRWFELEEDAVSFAVRFGA